MWRAQLSLPGYVSWGLHRNCNTNLEVFGAFSLILKTDILQSVVVQASVGSNAHSDATSGRVPEWVLSVVQRLKGLMLEADRRANKGEADARIAQQQVALVSHRIGLLDALLTRCTSE